MPENTLDVDDEIRAKVDKLIGLLEDDDDVEIVWTNME
jgi:transcriptional/translational regulatory protein YebC/TACO1